MKWLIIIRSLIAIELLIVGEQWKLLKGGPEYFYQERLKQVRKLKELRDQTWQLL